MIEILAAAEPNAGWSKLSALVVTGVVFWGATNIYKRVMGIDKALAAPEKPRGLDGVKAQVSIGSDPIVDPTLTPSAKGQTDLDELVRAQVGTLRPSQIIRTARARLGVSESTVKRAIKRARSAA